MAITAYEMRYDKLSPPENTQIECTAMKESYFDEYKEKYNECFYDMRKALGIRPYDWLSTFDQIAHRLDDIFLLVRDDKIIGSVSCCGNEIDDLFVSKKYQGQGIGKQLLLWGMNHIRQKNNNPITLHVAQWNENAVNLYRNLGFIIANIEHIG